jgi:hypothetical protein
MTREEARLEALKAALVLATVLIQIGAVLYLSNPSVKLWARQTVLKVRWQMWERRWKRLPGWYREAWKVRGRSPVE